MFDRLAKYYFLRVNRRLLVPESPHEMSEEEALSIDRLRQNVRALPPLESGPESGWLRHRQHLREALLYEDPRRFMEWKTIRSTMNFEPPLDELRYLKHLPDWHEIRQALRVPSVGQPTPYFALPETNGNLIHLAYTLCRFLGTVAADLGDMVRIFEFGGGFGGMCRLIFNYGFTGEYAIYDFPEMLYLQEYYLNSLPAGVKTFFGPTAASRRQITFLRRPEEIERHYTASAPPDLCIATWSLSETPLHVRDLIMGSLSPRFWLIAYQEKYEQFDNGKYFAMLQENREYRWRQFQIEHIKGNYFLFGAKRSLPIQ